MKSFPNQTIHNPQLSNKLAEVENDHSYIYSPKVWHRYLDAAHEKIQKLSTVQKCLIKKQKRLKFNINNFKDVVMDLRKFNQQSKEQYHYPAGHKLPMPGLWYIVRWRYLSARQCAGQALETDSAHTGALFT